MAGEKEIRIKLSADGQERVIAALKSLEAGGKRTGAALEKAGKSGGSSFTTARTAVSGLNSILNTTANVSTSVFTGITAGGALISGAFNTATGAVSTFRGALDTLRSVSVEAAADVQGLRQLTAALQESGPGSTAFAGGYLDALASLSYDAERGDVVDMLNDISTKVREAADGSEDAAKIFSDLGVSITDLVDVSTGQLKKPAEMLDAIVVSASRVDRSLRNNALERIIGTGGVRQFAPLFDSSSDEIARLTEEYKGLANVSDEVVAASEKVMASQKRMQAAIKGVSNALLAGMGSSIADVNSDFTDFLVQNQGKVEQFGRVVGDFSEEIYGRLMEFASAVVSDLSGVGGDLANGPLKTGADAIVQALDWMLDRLEEVASYVGRGEGAPWIDALVTKFQSALEAAKSFTGGVADFAAFIRDDVAPAIRDFADGMSRVYEFLGVDSAGAQIGITLALATFGSTIASVTIKIGAMIAGLTGIAGAITGAMASISSALLAAAPAAALIAAPVVGAMAGKHEADVLASADDLYSRTVDVAREHGDKAGAAFAIAGEAAIKDKAGTSWLDAALGAFDGYDSASERVASLKVDLEGLSKDEILKEVTNGVRAAGVALDDTLEIDFGAGITITGAEINAAVQSQLAAIPATIEVTRINGLQEQIDRTLNAGSPARSMSALTEGVATTGAMAPVTLQFNGQNVGQVQATTDQVAEIRRAQAQFSRGR